MIRMDPGEGEVAAVLAITDDPGNDTMHGGPGDDTLYGGAGSRHPGSVAPVNDDPVR